MIQTSEPLVMTIAEFAQATGTSRGLCYQLARQDKLPVPVIHIGSKRMVLSRKSVEALLNCPAEQKPKD